MLVNIFYNRIIYFILIFIVTSINNTALSKDIKIGSINYEKMIRECAPAKEAQIKLQEEFSKREKEILDIGKKIQSISDVSKNGKKVILSKKQLSLKNNLIRKKSIFEDDLMKRKTQELAKVFHRIDKAVKDIAEKDGYDLILQDPIYASPGIDITDKTLSLLKMKKN